MTYKELIYMCLDEIKATSDDSFITGDHIIFLALKYRGLLLKQRYSDIKKPIPESNYQTICLDLLEVPAIAGEPCEGGSYLRSSVKIPNIIKIGNPRIYAVDYFNGTITYVSRDRMRYVGHNKYLQNIIYAALGPDNYLYFKSSNSSFLFLEKVKMTSIFEDAQEVLKLQCDTGDGEVCDILDSTFPIEESLVSELIRMVVQEALGIQYRPKDSANNDADDISDLIAWTRQNMKSNLQKQIEG